jgi:hypothetical protein
MTNDNQHPEPSIEEVREAVDRLEQRVSGIDTNLASLRDGVSQDLTHLLEAVTPLSTVLNPPEPPSAVVRAMEAIRAGLGPELVLDAMKNVPDAPIPFIGDPLSYPEPAGQQAVQAPAWPAIPPAGP